MSHCIEASAHPQTPCGPTDAARERAVWQRVRQSRQAPEPSPEPCPEICPEHCPESCPKPCPEPCPERPPWPSCPLCPPLAQLAVWCREEARDAALYRHLARCLPRGRRCLLELAREEAAHARRLGAYLAAWRPSGPCPSADTRVEPDRFDAACPLELLRRRYRAELQAAERYLDAAHCAHGPLAELLTDLSRDEARHARVVLCLLEGMV